MSERKFRVGIPRSAGIPGTLVKEHALLVGAQAWDIAEEIRNLLRERAQEAELVPHEEGKEMSAATIERLAAHYALELLFGFSNETLQTIDHIFFGLSVEHCAAGAYNRGTELEADPKDFSFSQKKADA